MNKNLHKIDADDRCVNYVLNDQKYTVDYFQREYNWRREHIEKLITDLTSTFLDAYQEGDVREDVKFYNNYYLGSFVICSKNGTKSIIDGQQRLTSLTLLFIYLNHLKKKLEKELDFEAEIGRLIYSDSYGTKSFNIHVEERFDCLEQLFKDGTYLPKPDDDPSTINMVERYSDIEKEFPEELMGKVFPYFLDWLRKNVILVEITTYSDENAYAIFESMNDRGLNLTSTEMLKGYILSRFTDSTDRKIANGFWKDSIQKLKIYRKEEDQQYFQAWLRSQYAVTIRPGKVGSTKEDFEKIGTHFHSWFRDNLQRVDLKADSPAGFKEFVHSEMKFYLQAYFSILDAQKEEKTGWEHVFYIKHWGIAPSLAFALMLAPLKPSDSPSTVQRKINEVALYIETFAVRRSVNFKKFGASSIRYTMYTLVKEIRGKSLEALHECLARKLNEMEEGWDGLLKFRMHGQNRRFVKFLLSRITGFVEQQSGTSTNFSTYFVSQGTKPFEVEHIWWDSFNEHRDEFEQQHDFWDYRNKIGDLLLLPNGTNQSYGTMPYKEKLEHYLKENLWAQTLHPMTYKNNPNFLGMATKYSLTFKPHKAFKKADIDERQLLVRDICMVIWEN